MSYILFTAGACPRCKIAKKFMDERGTAYEEFDIEAEGMETFRQFYGNNRSSIFRGKEGIEFPVFTDGTVVRQGVGMVIAYLAAGTKLEGFIGRSELFKGWVSGLHISGGTSSSYDDLVTVLNFLQKNGLQLQLDVNGKNGSLLERLLKEKLGARVIMDVKGPLVLYRQLLGEEIGAAEIQTSIGLVPRFPDYQFQTVVTPVVRREGVANEVSYLTPQEIGETARLIKEASGSPRHPYLLRMFQRDACLDDRLKTAEDLAYNDMFRYRTAARQHLPMTEIEKI